MISTEVLGQQIHIGDTLRVHSQVEEGGKVRVQIFEGLLISLRGRQENQTFAVRRITGGIGVERTWPLDSKSLVKIEVKKKAGKIRRAKLYYLRGRVGKSAMRA